MGRVNKRTYSKKNVTANKTSFAVVDDLLETNRKRRNQFKRRKIMIGELPPPDPRTLLSSNDSLNVDINDTFDKIKAGPKYNDVPLKPVIYNKSTSESSISKSNLQVSVSMRIHSPVMKHKRKRKNVANKKAKLLLDEITKKKETTLDKSVVSSLEIEKEKFEYSSNLLCSNSISQVQKIDNINNSTAPSYHALFADTFQEKNKIAKICSTPKISSTPLCQRNNLSIQAGVSPIPQCPAQPVIHASFTPKQNKRRTCRHSILNDPKLEMKTSVLLSSSLGILGIEHSVDLKGTKPQEQNQHCTEAAYNLIKKQLKNAVVNVTRCSITQYQPSSSEDQSSCACKSKDSELKPYENPNLPKDNIGIEKRTVRNSPMSPGGVYVTLRSRKVKRVDKPPVRSRNPLLKSNSMDAAKAVNGNSVNVEKPDLIATAVQNHLINVTPTDASKNGTSLETQLGSNSSANTEKQDSLAIVNNSHLINVASLNSSKNGTSLETETERGSHYNTNTEEQDSSAICNNSHLTNVTSLNASKNGTSLETELGSKSSANTETQDSLAIANNSHLINTSLNPNKNGTSLVIETELGRHNNTNTEEQDLSAICNNSHLTNVTSLNASKNGTSLEIETELDSHNNTNIEEQDSSAIANNSHLINVTSLNASKSGALLAIETELGSHNNTNTEEQDSSAICNNSHLTNVTSLNASKNGTNETNLGSCTSVNRERQDVICISLVETDSDNSSSAAIENQDPSNTSNSESLDSESYTLNPVSELHDGSSDLFSCSSDSKMEVVNISSDDALSILKTPTKIVKREVQSDSYKSGNESTVVQMKTPEKVENQDSVAEKGVVMDKSLLQTNGNLSGSEHLDVNTCKNHLSDILEDCEENDEQDTVSDGLQFVSSRRPIKSPRRKSIFLQPGKNYRRSLSLLRHTIFEETRQQCLSCNGGCYSCSSCKKDQESQKTRLSFRVVPASTSVTQKQKFTELEAYAFTSGYVSNGTEDDTFLEKTIRELEISIRHSLILTKTPVPTARDIVLKRCGQTEPIPFEECYPNASLQHCQKIGEGVYGEVFLFRNKMGGTSVMKIIPIEGTLIVNGDRQKKFSEILSEMVIAQELSNLRNDSRNCTAAFSEVQQMKCVQGRYPERLLELWDLFNEDRGSENDSPEVFGKDQLYIVLELGNGGKDMEAFMFNNAQQSYALFKQTACALAVAENALEFEHRDLHWGNVLITCCDKNKQLPFRLDGMDIEISTFGVEVCIIDFTMSRIKHDGVVIYNDLAQDDELFTATGDYQFEVYRLMQSKNGNEWEHFEPYTNVIWLHYILDKMVSALRYKNQKTKIHNSYLNELENLKSTILDFNSVKHFVTTLFM